MTRDLILEDLSVHFATPEGAVRAVHRVSTRFIHGRITGIIGESGSGKSILGLSLLGLLPDNAAVSGSCLYKGLELNSPDIVPLRGKELALIPQHPAASLNPSRAVGTQISEAPIYHRLLGRQSAQQKSHALMEQLGLDCPQEMSRQYPFQLSGGMNQRIVSAMGLACAPVWIIADEPTKGLDAIIRNQVYGVLKEIHHEDMGMIVITHDLMLAGALCDTLCVMYAGEIVEEGPARALLADPEHPYTQGLLNALPERGMIPIPAPAFVPQTPPPCAFFPRCSRATSECARSTPPMTTLSRDSNRKVRCLNAI